MKWNSMAKIIKDLRIIKEGNCSMKNSSGKKYKRKGYRLN